MKRKGKGFGINGIKKRKGNCMVNITFSVKDLDKNFDREKYEVVQIKRPDGVIEILIIPKGKERL